MSHKNRPIRVEHIANLSILSKIPTRAYASIDTAAPGALKWAMLKGKVGDKFVIYHAVTGLELGCLRVLCSGRVDINYTEK